ncbi:MAG: hypothetical protein V1793_16010 [Pseudomonadota bacterium]
MNRKSKQFISKLIFFFALNLVILAGLLVYFSGQQREIHLSYDETESNLLVLGEKVHYRVVLLGTSRGRVLSRDGNHTMVEQILGGRVANLSKGGGGGLMPAEVHLSWFYHQGNRSDQVIYLVDPWIFYSSINNENNNFFLRDEPFELFIFFKLIRDGYSLDRLFSYLQMITVTDWKQISRYSAPGLTNGTLKAIDEKKTQDARRNYLENFDRKSYIAYGPVVERINRLVRHNNGRITYVMLPLLMKDFPGLGEVDAFLRETAAREEGMDYYNFASCMQETKWYYDHMHFNKAGIGQFLKYGILPLLEGKRPLLDNAVGP